MIQAIDDIFTFHLHAKTFAVISQLNLGLDCPLVDDDMVDH